MRAALLPALLVLAGIVLTGLAQAQTPPAILARGFRIQASPAYEGTHRMGESAPVIVRIENLGADAAGVLLVGAPGDPGGVRYPVALPRGAKKAVPVSTFAPYGGGAQIVLQTDRGAVEIPLMLRFENARASLLAVGDGSGGFAFLERMEQPASKVPGTDGSRPLLVVAYARPEVLPESEAGLDRTSCIALLPGSERLNARQIAALRRYVLRGGHLVLCGGASAPILTDVRLAGMVPYSSLQPGEVTVRGRSVSIQRPRPIGGARIASLEGIPVVRRDYGLGRVSLFAADPIEGPFETVPNRAKLVYRALDLQRSAQMVRTPMESGPGTIPPGTPTAASTNEVDPFALPIPPTSSILLVLGAYFVVVLPINFLVLRAFRRLELAWFTAPLFAIGFAGLLFRNAGSLYSTGLSHASQTAVFASSGGREGLALGKTQIFFPSATRGPIAIAGAEAIGADLFQQTGDYGYYAQRTNARPLDVIVTDAPAVPDYGSTALEFRDVQFRQTIDLGQGIRVIGPRSWRPGASREILVVNNSPYTLRDVRVAHGPTRDAKILGTDEKIPPGGRKLLRAEKALNMNGTSGVYFRDAPMLVATVDGAPVGPQLGTRIGSRSWTRLVVSGEVR